MKSQYLLPLSAWVLAALVVPLPQPHKTRGNLPAQPPNIP